MRYFIHTFGCQMNENDSSAMAVSLRGRGYVPAASCEEADIIIVNTCCVRENAENRAFGYIGSLKQYKERRPELVIVVCGCMAQRQGVAERLYNSYRHVSVVLGTFAGAKLPLYIAEYQDTGRRIIDVEERYDGQELGRDGLIASAPGYRAQVNIIYGCNNFCSYCIVPYVRGRERSRSQEDILREIGALGQNGVKEIQLLGQNVNSYGKDRGEKEGFAALLSQVCQIDGIQRVRYMTSHPRDFSPELTETIASLPKVCRHFHLPLQSGCDRLLKLMNRGYTTDYYLGLLERIRAACPEAVITTDLIVGFPGETEEDFSHTLDFVAACDFDAAYTFIYSRRSGTRAADMDGQVDEAVKKERIQMLMERQNPISLRRNQALVGETLPIMVEGPSKNRSDMLSGRTDGNKIVVFSAAGQKLLPGAVVKVHIDQAQTWNLIGSLR